jgi:exodeoxyribonuclease VIII
MTFGRTVSIETLEWWEDKDERSKQWELLNDSDLNPIEDDLDDFAGWLEDKGVKRVWGNGASFDNTILRSLFESFGKVFPVHYIGDLDLRTLTYLWNRITKTGRSYIRPNLRVWGPKHDALADAQSEALQAQSMYMDLKGSKYVIHQEDK